MDCWYVFSQDFYAMCPMYMTQDYPPDPGDQPGGQEGFVGGRQVVDGQLLGR